ncbi:MAG: AbrB/MazE/SpoVT family DNA-binding domain-containing protein [Thermoanaerobacterales bacterium]|nr:AbrB/MazE/SpoVT family DNA-binding domain-containing protein [Thermoanaerobacterales bacterium]
MNQAMKHKVISKGGGLTIPADVRREYNFLAGEAVDITVDDGRIVISQHTPRCMFCQSHENVGKYMGRNVCRSCVARMAEEVGTNG